LLAFLERQFFRGYAFLFLIQAYKIPYPQIQFTGINLFSVRYFSGGPRLPNTSMVIIVPVLQQGHLLNKGVAQA